MSNQHEELIAELRAYLGMPADLISDEEVLSATRNTYCRAVIELRLAWRQLWREVRRLWSAKT